MNKEHWSRGSYVPVACLNYIPFVGMAGAHQGITHEVTEPSYSRFDSPDGITCLLVADRTMPRSAGDTRANNPVFPPSTY